MKFCAVSHIFVYEIAIYVHIYVCMIIHIIFNGTELHNKLFLINYILYASEEKVP